MHWLSKCAALSGAMSLKYVLGQENYVGVKVKVTLNVLLKVLEKLIVCDILKEVRI